jgi:cell division protein FtsZ
MDVATAKTVAAQPKVALPTADSLNQRVPARRDFYKGESNLKRLDTPSYVRRPATPAPLHEQEEQEQSSFGLNKNRQVSGMPSSRNTLINGKVERIDKSDTDQPAFLRRIMD